MFLAMCSDIVRHRYGFAAFSGLIPIAGYGLLLGTNATEGNNQIRFADCFLVISGLYTGMPLLICWVNMNFSGQVRKMTVLAFQFGFENVGGIIASFIYRNYDAPGYLKGL